jgi:hypothetical protein
MERYASVERGVSLKARLTYRRPLKIESK